MKQLTFEQLAQRRRQAQAIDVNPSVPIEEAPRLKDQTRAIYAALQRGPLWTRNLRAMAAQYNARLKELREYLREFGQTVDLTLRGDDGNNKYELRPFAGSHYQAELMAKQQKADAGKQRAE